LGLVYQPGSLESIPYQLGVEMNIDRLVICDAGNQRFTDRAHASENPFQRLCTALVQNDVPGERPIGPNRLLGDGKAHRIPLGQRIAMPISDERYRLIDVAGFFSVDENSTGHRFLG